MLVCDGARCSGVGAAGAIRPYRCPRVSRCFVISYSGLSRFTGSGIRLFAGTGGADWPSSETGARKPLAIASLAGGPAPLGHWLIDSPMLVSIRSATAWGGPLVQHGTGDLVRSVLKLLV